MYIGVYSLPIPVYIPIIIDNWCLGNYSYATVFDSLRLVTPIGNQCCYVEWTIPEIFHGKISGQVFFFLFILFYFYSSFPFYRYHNLTANIPCVIFSLPFFPTPTIRFYFLYQHFFLIKVYIVQFAQSSLNESQQYYPSRTQRVFCSSMKKKLEVKWHTSEGTHIYIHACLRTNTG